MVSVSCGGRARSLGKPKQLEFSQKSTGKEGNAHREHSGDLQKVFEYSVEWVIITCMQENDPRMRKKLSKRISRNSTLTSQRAAYDAYLHQPE